MCGKQGGWCIIGMNGGAVVRGNVWGITREINPDYDEILQFWVVTAIKTLKGWRFVCDQACNLRA